MYIETTVISYLTARPARDVVVAGHQQSTRDWWETASRRFELVVSELVRQEAGIGDQDAARARFSILDSLATLDASAGSDGLSETLVRTAAVPHTAIRDAAHIAIAAANGVEYLVTWNFRHIANAVARPLIESACRTAGFEPPTICTPEELMEDIDSEG
ncbi:MAG: type II toxin-antitoxin system VapC family toxin [Spirochaetaceae bacterium]|nr:type II toxin-antitoxin system VapC family toxin [Spirochaetaceae bacterium]